MYFYFFNMWILIINFQNCTLKVEGQGKKIHADFVSGILGYEDSLTGPYCHYQNTSTTDGSIVFAKKSE